MKPLFKLYWANIKITVRNKQAIFWTLIFPIIFLVIFGLFDLESLGSSKILLIDEADNAISQGIVEGFEEIDYFDAESTTNANELEQGKQKVEDGELDYVLVLPASIDDLEKAQEDAAAAEAAAQAAAQANGNINRYVGTVAATQTAAAEAAEIEPIDLVVYYNEANLTTNQMVLNTIEQITGHINTEIAQTPQFFALEKEPITDKEVRYIDFLMPGILAMSLMQSAVIGIVAYLMEAREKKILKRILATPVNRKYFVAAQILSQLTVAIAQIAIILATAKILYDVTIYGSLLSAFLIAMLGTFVFLCFGFIIASISKTTQAAEALAQVITMPMLFLSGVFFSTETLPKAVQYIVDYLPLTPMIDALREIITNGATLAETFPGLWVLIGWLVVMFIGAILSFRTARE